MCGIVGMYGNGPVNQELYDALTVLQHRGQDAAGIVTEDDDGHLHLRKDNGLVRDVFRTRHMRNLIGNMGIGQITDMHVVTHTGAVNGLIIRAIDGQWAMPESGLNDQWD